MKLIEDARLEPEAIPAGQRAASHSSIRRCFGAALLAAMTVPVAAADGHDATWLGYTSNWNNRHNWSPAIQPMGTATFGASDNTTITFSRSLDQLDTLEFDAGAPAYTFKIGNRFQSESLIVGAGIVNRSSSIPLFSLRGAGGDLTFVNSSTADDARINVSRASDLEFFDGSTAGRAAIANAGLFDFSDNSSAGSADIANAGHLQFFESSAAGHASILNDGTLSFFNSSTAEDAAIVTDKGGQTDFFDHGTGGQAQFAVNAGGAFDLSGLATPGMTAGSIAGAGNFLLGSKSLIVGGNDMSSEVSGVIADGGLSAGLRGSLIKTGIGTLILSGRNTYTGGTTINGGVLQLGDGGAGGSILGHVLDDAVLAIDRSDDVTLSNRISGTGRFEQFGAGTTILTAANTFSGGTTIAAGTLVIGADDNLGAGLGGVTFAGSGTLRFLSSFATDRPVTLDPSGTFDPNDNNVTLGGIVSGPGGLSETGAGTLVLTGNNTYTGGTTITAGTLQLGNGGTIGSIVGNVVDNGTFAIDRSDMVTFDGAISGAGGFRQLGAGTTILTADNTYSGGTTISAGILQLGNGGASGSIVGNVLDNGVLAVDRSDTFSYGGAISGTGAFQQNGSGQTILTGVSNFTGPTTVNAGILTVEGSLLSPVLVNSGGAFTGTGTVGGLAVGNGGRIASNNLSGALNVNGNVSFAPGSIFSVEANAAGQADKIAATGKASLSGGTVQVSAAAGNYAPVTNYPILTAAGGITGSFADVTSDLAILTPSLSSNADDVFLTLARNAFFFSSIAQTSNQKAVAGALDASPYDSGLVQAVAPLNDGQALQAFDALSGDIHGSVQTTLVDDARYIRQAMLDRLRIAGYADESGPLGSLALGGPMTAFGLGGQPQLASLSGAGGVLPPPAMAPVAGAPGAVLDLTVWGQAFGAWGQVDGNGNAAGVSDTLGGFVTGVDRRFGANWRAGLAAGYSGSSVTSDAGASSAGVNTGWVGGYAGGKFGAWSLRGGSAFGWSGIGTTRDISLPDLVDRATAGYGGHIQQVFGELGYGLAVDPIAVEPFGGLAFVHLGTGSFTEDGGAAALSGSGDSESVGYSTLGMRTATRWLLANGMTVMPRASVAWQHAFGNTVPTAALAFESTGQSFGIAGVPIARDSALVDIGLDLVLSPRAAVGLHYDGQIGGSAWDQAVEGRLTWRF
jgi:fibronectin-binding autotransporter adhesin